MDAEIPAPFDAGFATMTADETSVYLLPGNGSFLAVEAASGRLVWRREYLSSDRDPSAWLPPRLSNGLLFARPVDTRRLLCLSVEDGTDAWLGYYLARELHFAPGPGIDVVTFESWPLEIRTLEDRRTSFWISPLGAAGDGAFDRGLLLLPAMSSERTARPVPEVAIHWIEIETGASVARLPLHAAGDLHLHEGSILFVGSGELIGLRLPPLSEWPERRDAYRRRLAGARRTWRPADFDLALEAATSPAEVVEATLDRTEALLRSGRTWDALYAYLDLHVELDGWSHRRDDGGAIEIGTFVRRRLRILFDLAGRDAEALDLWFAPFRSAAAAGRLSEDDRRKLRGLPAELVPADLLAAIR